MTEIRLQALAHSYVKRPKASSDFAVKGIDHVWEQGGAYALLGPSGCGKSTLLNIISGLLKPSSGQVLFDGAPVNNLSPQERNIAQVFQFPVVYDSMTVFENLAFPLRNLKYSNHEISARVNAIAKVLELEDVLSKRANNLAADAKQKISMGRGLVREDVSAILFDEPLTVIDPHLKWKLRRKLKQIHEQFNITMVYVTHDQLEAATFADKIAVMYQGQIVQFGTPQELFEQPQHTFVGYFIGSPGMNLIPVTLQGRGVVFDNQEIPLSNKLLAKLAEQSAKQITLGIRPEFVELCADPKPDTHLATVIEVEDLGSYSLLTLRLGNQLIKARLEEGQPLPTKQANVQFPAEWVRIFADDRLVSEPTDE